MWEGRCIGELGAFVGTHCATGEGAEVPHVAVRCRNIIRDMFHISIRGKNITPDFKQLREKQEFGNTIFGYYWCAYYVTNHGSFLPARAACEAGSRIKLVPTPSHERAI